MPRSTSKAISEPAAAAAALPVEADPRLSSYEELQTALEAAQARISELEEARQDQLSQVLWLQRTVPGGRRRGVTPNGTPFIQFGAQYGALNRQTGSRTFGAWKNFVAYGEAAEAIGSFFDGGTDRLCRIGAYERPWHGEVQGPDGPTTTRNTEWVVTTFEPIARLDSPAAPVREPEAPFSGEPTSEEVPF